MILLDKVFLLVLRAFPHERVDTLCAVIKVKDRLGIDCLPDYVLGPMVMQDKPEKVVITITVTVNHQVLSDNIDICYPSYSLIDLVFELGGPVYIAVRTLLPYP